MIRDAGAPAPGVAVVGAGSWGRHLVRNYADLGVLRVVCDLEEAALARAAGLCPGARTTRDFESVLRDPEVRGVVIALPAALHFDFARRALAAGKDVCVEKPLALRAREARALTEGARERGSVLMVGHVLRYHPAFVALKRRVEEGGLGEIRRIEASRLDPGSGAPTDASPLWDLAPHDVSMILALAGQAPEDVSAEATDAMGSRDVSLSFSTGLRARVRVSRSHPFRERRFTVTLERGRIVFDDALPWSRKLTVHPAPEAAGIEAAPATVPVPEAEPLREECRHFVECMAARRRPRTDGVEGLQVVEVLERAEASEVPGGLPERVPNRARRDAFVP